MGEDHFGQIVNETDFFLNSRQENCLGLGRLIQRHSNDLLLRISVISTGKTQKPRYSLEILNITIVLMVSENYGEKVPDLSKLIKSSFVSTKL